MGALRGLQDFFFGSTFKMTLATLYLAPGVKEVSPTHFLYSQMHVGSC